MKDVFAVQDAIARQVAGALAVSLTQVEQRRALSKPTESLDAYDLVLRGRERLLGLHAARQSRGTSAASSGRPRLDPEIRRSLCLAWQGVSRSWRTYGWTEDLDGSRASAPSSWAENAVTLDPDSHVPGHRVIGLVHLARGPNTSQASPLRSIARSSLNPSDSVGLQAHVPKCCSGSAASIEAIQASEAAIRCRPAPATSRTLLQPGHGLLRGYGATPMPLRVLERGVARGFPKMRPSTHAALAATFAQLGRPADATRERDDASGGSVPSSIPLPFGSQLSGPGASRLPDRRPRQGRLELGAAKYPSLLTPCNLYTSRDELTD